MLLLSSWPIEVEREIKSLFNSTHLRKRPKFVRTFFSCPSSSVFVNQPFDHRQHNPNPLCFVQSAKPCYARLQATYVIVY